MARQTVKSARFETTSRLRSRDDNRHRLARATNDEIIERLGFSGEIRLLKQLIEQWIGQSSKEIRTLLKWQFLGNSKYFRPLAVFSCFRAMTSTSVPTTAIRSAFVVEMFHNVSLIIDDILDQSPRRRGIPTLHFKFGLLPALMTSGYIVADGYAEVVDDPFEIKLFSELMKRLAVAECLQWRLRRQPLGVDDWLQIASEDTGSMFEICACLGSHDNNLRRFGHLLGVLYHGCDDVGDAKGLESLGGGGDEDLRDGILTLPAAFAIRNPQIASLFCSPHPTEKQLARIAAEIKLSLHNAEAYLDHIAEDAKTEARLHANDPTPLMALVDHVRELSNR